MPIRSWDIFCTVIDNFGDIGVCWRLARQLAQEHGHAVRLWVDDLASFSRLAPEIDVTATHQRLAGVDVHTWDPKPEAPFEPVTPHDVVIEAFACHLPEPLQAAMAAADRKPIWINLEYDDLFPVSGSPTTFQPWALSARAIPSSDPPALPTWLGVPLSTWMVLGLSASGTLSDSIAQLIWTPVNPLAIWVVR